MFKLENGHPCDALQWLNEWEPKYPSNKYDEKQYETLIGKEGILSTDDFIQIGRWKDAAQSNDKWRPNVASVAFPAWRDASVELPNHRIEEATVEAFLKKWTHYSYPDASSRNKNGKKRMGLSRATTLLHFMTGGQFPIFDSNIRRAAKSLCNRPAPNRIEWYMASYIPFFRELVTECRATARRVDKALHAYGRATLFSQLYCYPF